MLVELIQAATIKDIVVSERMKVYEASFKFDIENAPAYSYFSNIIQFVSQRDRIKIILEDEAERIFDFSNTSEESYKAYIRDALVDEIVDVRIKIDKDVIDDHFSVYAFNEFVNDILSLSIEEVMISFSDLLKQVSEILVFDIYDTVRMFATKSMFFVPFGNSVTNSEFNRSQRIEKCKEVSYFYNFDTYELLPDDFKLMIDYESNPLTELFQKLTFLLSISFIATSSSISGSYLKGIINGQRTMEYQCEINQLPNNKNLYSIYNWIYTEGNAIDKAIIARNVISLHCKYVPVTEIDDKVMASIQSNYNLYLKENVKEYLDLKNKVAEFISETISKTGEYATGLLDKFKGNIIAIFGFMFSVILANVVSDQPLDNIFTKEITTLVECVIVGSFVYLVICYLQSRYEIQKVYDSYNQLKQNYKEILTEEDLHEIFGDDEMLFKVKKTISKSEKIYMGMWILFLISVLIVVECLSSSPNIQFIIDFVKKIYLSVCMNNKA